MLLRNAELRSTRSTMGLSSRLLPKLFFSTYRLPSGGIADAWVVPASSGVVDNMCTWKPAYAVMAQAFEAHASRT
jgi:hypothetical protein